MVRVLRMVLSRRLKGRRLEGIRVGSVMLLLSRITTAVVVVVDTRSSTSTNTTDYWSRSL